MKKILELQPGQDHLEKVGRSNNLVLALSEFIWNSLDADATEVTVALDRNALDTIERIRVSDNGTGIAPAQAEAVFESVGDSWKKATRRTPANRAIHGREGQGRLRFFALAERATWTSYNSTNGGLVGRRIELRASHLGRATVSDVLVPDAAAAGTEVVLENLVDTIGNLATEDARLELACVFSPYLRQYPNATVIYDGQPLDTAAAIDEEFNFGTLRLVAEGDVVPVDLQVVEWKTTQGSRGLHFGGELGVVLGSQPANVTAPGFNFSAYAYSPYFQEIASTNLIEFAELGDRKFLKIAQLIRAKLADYFRQRKAEQSKGLIDDLKERGLYPYDGQPQTILEEKERQIFDIATHAISSYSSEFRVADEPATRITLKMLRQALHKDPESLGTIFEAVFNLPKKKREQFKELLEMTDLGNILEAASLVASRLETVEFLKAIVFERDLRKKVRERGELDRFVNENTWLFGEQFHLTIAEAGLTKVVDSVAKDLGLNTDPEQVRKADGKVGRVDTLLGRLVPRSNQTEREYLVVELKRPDKKVTRTELDQLEDYVRALVKRPEFIQTNTTWTFILLTGEYDENVEARITQTKRQAGIALEKDNYTMWVLTWGNVLREAEARLQFIQDQLQIDVSKTKVTKRIEKLRRTFVEDGRMSAAEDNLGSSKTRRDISSDVEPEPAIS